MKRVMVFSLILIAFSITLFAQPVLYGTNTIGNGNIVEYDVARNSLQIAYSFPNDGLLPQTLTELTPAGNGIFYGTTPKGGKWGSGVIFKLDSSSRAYTILYHFKAPTAEFPSGKLLILSDGKLYGIALGFEVDEQEYKQTNAVIYSFDLQSLQLEVLYTFEGVFHRVGHLGAEIGGKLYGNTSNLIFSFDLETREIEAVHVFEPYTGIDPRGGLTIASNGKFYGLTALGSGENVNGVLFSFDPTTNKYSVENNFGGQKGNEPGGTLTREKNGLMYGTTYWTIFSFNVNTKEITTLFNLEPDNDYPQHQYSFDLAMGYDEKLYGMDKYGFYSFNPVTGEYNNLQQSVTDLSSLSLQTFVANDTGLVAVNPSSLYFELIKKLDAPLGMDPQNEIIKGSDGKFYGATTKGGKFDYGGIFSFDPVNSNAMMLVDFDSRNIIPSNVLSEGLDKNIYYTTRGGGGADEGNQRLIRFNRNIHKLETIHEFPQNIYSWEGSGPLQVGKDSNIYGITYGGFGQSQLYRFNPTENVFEVIGYIQSANSILFGTDGKLYGTSGPDRFHKYYFFSFDINTGIEILTLVSTSLLKSRIARDSKGLFYIPDLYNKIYKFEPVKDSLSIIISFPIELRNISTPLMISNKDILYGSVTYREYQHPDSTQILQIIGVDPISGNYTQFELLEGAYTFNPTILLNENPNPKGILINIADTVFHESDGKASVKIKLNKPADSSFRLHYNTVPGTAIAEGPNKDFIPKEGFLKIRKGMMEETIQIVLKKDKLHEEDESFTILISKAPLLSDTIYLVDSIAVVTLKDGEKKQPQLLQVRTSAKNLITKPSTTTNNLSAFVYPNPSPDNFALLAHGKNTLPIQMVVSDGTGRLLEIRSINSDQLIQFGEKYNKGVYYLQLIQGKEKIVIKLVKP